MGSSGRSNVEQVKRKRRKYKGNNIMLIRNSRFSDTRLESKDNAP